MDETIEVVSSDEGNVPAVPSADTTPPAPSEPTEPVTPPVEGDPTPTPVPELFELPDGRKVDAATLAHEFKNNFLPDYTRKSQALAQINKAGDPPLPTSTDPLADPDWTPGSYAELLKVAQERAIQALEDKEQAKVAQQQEIENQVIAQLNEIKTTDPNLNETALFLHANKYGFRDLKQAHTNMQDMKVLAKTVQTTTAKNIAKRNDPVSMAPGATGSRPDPGHFSSARDYLKSLNN